MIFSSITFLFYFLPVVLILYFVVPQRFRNFVLMMLSLLFYGWGEPKYLICMMISICIGYAIGLALEKTEQLNKRKMLLILALLVNLGLLGYFKYANFFIENFHAVTGIKISALKVTLPVGISFYTFQILSYVIDVYRKDTKAQRNIVNLAAYITMFPQLIAGPIVRYTDIEKQLTDRNCTWEKAEIGIRRLVIGLGKKVLIANQLGELCNIFAKSQEPSVLFYWVNAIAFMLQIYFDFSGYSDMAIGLGKILGFEFVENFDYPYISKSITEFWRRWHMSLGTWFRDYVYIPLGGNRKGAKRQILNILVVWGLTGFWHGAEWNFLLWGLYFAVILIIEKNFLLKRLNASKVLGHIYTLILVLMGFVIFNVTGLGEIGTYLENMFGAGGLPISSPETVYYMKSYLPCVLMAMVGSTPLVKKIFGKWKGTVLEPIALICIFLLVAAWLVNGSFNPFLYFRF